MKQENRSAAPPCNVYRVVWGKQRFYLSVAWKTLIAYALVVFLPMYGITYLSENMLTRALHENAFGALSASSGWALRTQQERADMLAGALTHMAADAEIGRLLREKDQAGLAGALSQLAGLQPFADSLLAVDAQGVMVAGNHGAVARPGLESMLPPALDAGETFSSFEILPRETQARENVAPSPSHEPQAVGQVIAVPVYENGERLGTLAGVVRLDGFDRLSESAREDQGGDARIFGAAVQGERVFAATRHPDNFWVDGRAIPGVISESLSRGRPYSGKLVIDSTPVFVSAVPLFDRNMRAIGGLIVGTHADHYGSSTHDRLLVIYGAVAFAVLLSLLVAYLSYRDTIRPIRALVGAMDEFASGNQAVRTELRTKDEYEELGDGFNRMADAICQKQEQVAKYNSLSRLLISTLKVDELLKSALDTVMELTRSKFGAIYLYDKEGLMLEPVVTAGVDRDAVQSLGKGEGVAGSAVAERRTIVLETIPEKCHLRINTSFGYAMPDKVAAFPLMYKEKVLGALLLGTFNDFDPDDLDLMEYLSNQIAASLDNALTHEKTERLSITDGLTGLHNCRYFGERLSTEFSEAVRYGYDLSLLVMDIDFFKKVNDVYGHQVGDQALVTVAKVLAESVRDSDLVARYGGEEFVALLPHSTQKQAMLVAEKIRLAIAEAVVEEMGEQRLTISIGVANRKELAVTHHNDLVRKADEAMYQAKQDGRNRVVAAQA
jgi:diguanylate cyclase (GGDEF)-like protein